MASFEGLYGDMFGFGSFSNPYADLYPYERARNTSHRRRDDDDPYRPSSPSGDDSDILQDPAFTRVTRITPSVYLTNRAGAASEEFLRDLQIDCVICVSESHEVRRPKPPVCDFKRIPVPNDPSSAGPNIIQYFDEVADKIRKIEKRGGRVLVHSLKGRCRGPTLVIAYLMKYKGMSLMEAFATICGQRPCRPFPSFWKQLGRYEKELNERASDSK